jgi:hypothetical protein
MMSHDDASHHKSKILFFAARQEHKKTYSTAIMRATETWGIAFPYWPIAVRLTFPVDFKKKKKTQNKKIFFLKEKWYNKKKQKMSVHILLWTNVREGLFEFSHHFWWPTVFLPSLFVWYLYVCVCVSLQTKRKAKMQKESQLSLSLCVWPGAARNFSTPPN